MLSNARTNDEKDLAIQHQKDTNEMVKLNLKEIESFSNHPFIVDDNEPSMLELIADVHENGVLSPVLVRRKDNKYEMLSGHRRLRASEINGFETIPAVIMNLSDEDAAILMVRSNYGRSKLLPSERAFSYKILYDALKKKRGRKSEGEESQNVKTAELIGAELDINGTTFRKYVRLCSLNQNLLKDTDAGKLPIAAAFEIATLPGDIQELFFKNNKKGYPSPTQIAEFKRIFKEPTVKDFESFFTINEKKKASAKYSLDMGNIFANASFVDNLKPNAQKQFLDEMFKSPEFETFITDFYYRTHKE